MPAAAPPAEPAVKPRPRWLRALGHNDPPAEITAAGRRYRRINIYKHDAFAATALYADADFPDDTPEGENRLIVGKFARRQNAFGVPFAWLGGWFHRREQLVHQRLADCDRVPAVLGPVSVDGRPLPAAAARRYVVGHPLSDGERPADNFFPQLEQLVKAFHDRGVAIVDLQKRDNILVGDDGRPHLMDFQISLCRPRHTLRGIDFRTWLFGPAARADRYHLMKHWVRHRPDQLTDEQRDLDRYRTRGVRAWRHFVRPIHAVRRRLFVALRVRAGRGDPVTEISPESRTAPPLLPGAGQPNIPQST